MILYRISELMLPTIIQRYEKKSVSFSSTSKPRLSLTFYMLSDATFYDRINTIYQFIKPFLELKKKCLFLRNMEPLKYICSKFRSNKEIKCPNIQGKNGRPRKHLFLWRGSCITTEKLQSKLNSVVVSCIFSWPSCLKRR